MSDTPALPEPKRFAMNYDNGMLYESERGPWVRYLDHNAALAAQAEAHEIELAKARVKRVKSLDLRAELDRLTAERDALLALLTRIEQRCPTGSPVYVVGSIGDSIRIALAARAQGGTP
jgi:hypothetical protein